MKIKYFVILSIVLLLLAACGNTADESIEPVVKEEQVVQKATETCSDKIKNQGETGVDCGGPCDSCPTCKDGVKNQGEQEVDCGGPCTACETCFDGILNQEEIGIDCGGSCKACPEVDYYIKADEAVALKAKMNPSTKALFLTNSYPSGIEVGDEYIFALGITNTDYDETDGDVKFSIDVDFDYAKDLHNNAIDKTDAKVIETWFDKNKWETYTLKKYEQELIPVGVKVGDFISVGEKTQPGNYYFKLTVWDERNKKKEKHAELEFSFRVK